MPGFDRFAKKPQTMMSASTPSSAATTAAAAPTLESPATAAATTTTNAASSSSSSSIEFKTPNPKKSVTFGVNETHHLAAVDYEESPGASTTPFNNFGIPSPFDTGDNSPGIGNDNVFGVFGGGDGMDEFALENTVGGDSGALPPPPVADGGGGGGFFRFRGRAVQQEQKTAATTTSTASVVAEALESQGIDSNQEQQQQQHFPMTNSGHDLFQEDPNQGFTTTGDDNDPLASNMTPSWQQQPQENQTAAGTFKSGGVSLFKKQRHEHQQQPKHGLTNPSGDAVVIQQTTTGGFAGQEASFHNNNNNSNNNNQQQQKMSTTGTTKTVASTQNPTSSITINSNKVQPSTKAASIHPGPKNTTGLVLGAMPNLQQPSIAVQTATRPGSDTATSIARNGIGALKQLHQGQKGMPTNTTTLKFPHGNVQQRMNTPPPPTTTTTATKMQQPKDASLAAAVHDQHRGETNGVVPTSHSNSNHAQMQQHTTTDPTARSASNGSLASAPGRSQGQKQHQPTNTPARSGGLKTLPIAVQTPFANSVHTTMQAEAQQQQPAAAVAANAFSVTPDTRVARASSSNSTTTTEENSSILGNRGAGTGNVITPKNVAASSSGGGVVSTLDGGASGGASSATDDVSFDDLKNELLNELRAFDDQYDTYQEGMLNDHVALGTIHAELLIMLAQEMDLAAKIDEAIAMADEIIHNNGLEDAAAAAADASTAPVDGPVAK